MKQNPLSRLFDFLMGYLDASDKKKPSKSKAKSNNKGKKANLRKLQLFGGGVGDLLKGAVDMASDVL